jgi:hypothetical protein
MIPTLPLAYLATLLREVGVIELRACMRTGRWCMGLFDDAHALLRMAETLSAQGANLYTTLNRPHESIRDRVRNAMHARALRDPDIACRVRVPFDFDPARPRGVASNADELAAALVARERAAVALASLGWPEPARGMSGNGGHLLYRCLLPSTPELTQQLSTIYHGLFEDFTSGEVMFDRSVMNAARIWRLYGMVNRKGTATNERPHRLASIAVPRDWRALSPRLLDSLANAYAKRNARTAMPPRSSPPSSVRMPAGEDGSRGDLRTLDVVGWFAAHGAYRRAMAGGKHAVRCPWEEEHSSQAGALDSSSVVWEAHESAWHSFHCSHAHCTGRTIRDVMAAWGDADGYCSGLWGPTKRRSRT